MRKEGRIKFKGRISEFRRMIGPKSDYNHDLYDSNLPVEADLYFTILNFATDHNCQVTFLDDHNDMMQFTVAFECDEEDFTVIKLTNAEIVECVF